MKQEKLVVYTDGGARGNPGPAGVGVVIADERGKILHKYSKAIGVRTNNEAEYEAVILAFQKLKHLFGESDLSDLEIELRLDSQLIARQLRGEYKVKMEHLKPLFMEASALKKEFGKVEFVEIPREKNKEADAMANEAMDNASPHSTIF
jgi:ribonuclease HI